MVNKAKKVITIAPLSNNDNKIRVAAYCRVSTDSNDQLNSFYAQVKYYTDYIRLNENMRLVDIYADEGITGTSIEKRADFKRLISDVKKKKIDRVLVKSVTRFARNALECIETVRLFKSNGTSIYFENDNIDTEQMNSEMILYIKSAFAQGEALSASRRMAVSSRMKMADGTYNLASAPYGYRLSKDGLVIEPNEAIHVRKIFELYLVGMGECLIAQFMNEHYPEKRWGKRTICCILKNERYVGDCLLQKNYSDSTLPLRMRKNNGELPQYYYEGTHEAIISKEDFDKAQLLRKNRHPLYNKANRRTTKDNFFYGKIYCRYCGWVYKSSIRHDELFWRCSKKGQVAEKCYAPNLLDDEVQSTFVHLFNILKQNENDIVHDTLLQMQTIKMREHGTSEELKDIDRQIAELSEQSRIYTELYTQGALDEMTFYRKADMLKNKITELRSQRLKVLNMCSDDGVLNALRKLEKVLLDTDFLMDFSGDVFDSIVEKIYVEQEGKLTFVMRSGLEFTMDREKL